MQPLNVKTPPLRAVASGEMAMQGGLNRVQVAAHGAMVLAPAVHYFSSSGGGKSMAMRLSAPP